MKSFWSSNFDLGNIYWEQISGTEGANKLVHKINRDRVAKAHRYFKLIDSERKARIELVQAPKRFSILHTAAA